MTPEFLEKIAAEANLAPSAHNTQPTRWAMDGQNAIVLSLDPARLLPVGDPENKDARLSGGAALYGTMLALARHGHGVSGWEISDDVARLAIAGPPGPVQPIETLKSRTTFRAGFAQASPELRKSLSNMCAGRSDTALTQDAHRIAMLSELNDQVSLAVMRSPSFRRELVDWMRLRASDPRWALDGLSAESLALSGLEARVAGIALGRPVFEILDRLGFGKAIVSEHGKTVTATGLVAFHRPAEEDRWTSGGKFYEFWLALTAAGFAAWPMAVLADDPTARREVMKLFELAEERELITVLRVGPHPGNRQPEKARLPADQLVTKA